MGPAYSINGVVGESKDEVRTTANLALGPNIEGLHSFTGPLIHSANWDGIVGPCHRFRDIVGY